MTLKKKVIFFKDAFKKKKKDKKQRSLWSRRKEEIRWRGNDKWKNTCGLMEMVRELLGNFLLKKLFIDTLLSTTMPQVKS